MRTKAEFLKEKIIITQTPFHSSKINNSLKRDKNSKQLFTYFNFPPKIPLADNVASPISNTPNAQVGTRAKKGKTNIRLE